MTEPELVCVDPQRVEEMWPHVSHLIDAACERFGTQDERKELEASVKSGKALLWIAWSDKIEAALVTDLVKEDDYLVCRLRALSGDTITRWIALLKKIEQYADDEGCRLIRYVGRRGWAFVLNDYRITHIHAEKRLRG